MKKVIIIFLFFLSIIGIKAQGYTAYTSYAFDKVQSNLWKYSYIDGWVYAHAYSDNPRNFYFRFKKSELGLHELSRSEWRVIKNNDGWDKNKACTFEYYVTDDYPSIKDALKENSWPCAKYYHYNRERPIVKKTAKVKTAVHYTDDDEIRDLAFFFEDGSIFGITVHWDYTGYNMRYTY